MHWQQRAEARRRDLFGLFKRHRGTFPPPIYFVLLNCIASKVVERLLKFSGVAALLFPIAYGLVCGSLYGVEFQVCGLVLDICGFSLLFIEWTMAHDEGAQRETDRIDEAVGWREPWSEAELEAVGRGTITKQLADGVREKEHEHLTIAFIGASMIICGFVYQLLGSIIKS